MPQPGLFSSFPVLSLSVSELTTYLRQLLESDGLLQNVSVRGEISNLSRPSSGHIYFTLKDAGASLRCVIWRSSAQRLRGNLENGMAVEARGAVSVYESAGQYQLYVDSLKLTGDGWLYQEFLRLKDRLEADGLFDPGRKRPIPAFPSVVGIVTSPTGAALQDMLNILGGRYAMCEVVVAPAMVQGEDAPLALCAAIRALNRRVHPDVIILARGGGSLEDLWAFNDERVVRAVVASAAPVITGIGHETDFTLCDFAADLRAPTPTGAAVSCSPDAAELRRELRSLAEQVSGLMLDRVDRCRAGQRAVLSDLNRLSPQWQVRNGRQRLDALQGRGLRAVLHRQQLRLARAAALSDRLAALNPMAVLQRGYAVVTDNAGHLVSQAAGLQAGQAVRVRMADGSFGASVTDVQAASQAARPQEEKA